jgi:hypothetical protein
MFPGMSTEQLVQRRRELLTDMSTEYVPDTRRMICGAVLKLDAELLDRRGFVYDQEDVRFLDSLRERMDHVSRTIQAMRRRAVLGTTVAQYASDEWWRPTDA